MILLQFRTGQGLHLGVKTLHGIVDITAALNDTSSTERHDAIPASLAAVCAGGSAACAALERFVQHLLTSDSDRHWLHDEATVTFGPCVANLGKIICVGLNYRRHALESGMAIPTVPVLFSKFPNTIAAPSEQIVLSATCAGYLAYLF